MARQTTSPPTQSTEGPPEVVNTALVLWVLSFVLIFIVASIGLTLPMFHPGNVSTSISALGVLISNSVLPMAWFVAAAGYGRIIPLQDYLSKHPRTRLAIGCAILLWLDHSLGALGLLQWSGNIGAIAILLVGWAGIAVAFRSSRTANDQSNQSVSSKSTWIARLTFCVPLALAVTAATSAPGFLWDSEYGGFDALSYHLQLPREWLAARRVVPFEHNVYSFLPSYVEAAYYHIGILQSIILPTANGASFSDGVQGGAIACQLLHVGFIVVLFGVLCEWLQQATQSSDENPASQLFGRLLAVGMVSVPWVLVVGSLAYNEIPALLFLASSLVLIGGAKRIPPYLLVYAGFVLGCAAGVKLTSAGFVIAPVLVWLTATNINNRKNVIRSLIMIAVGGSVALIPYALRNFVATEFTNPFFPFLTSVFGTAHWNDANLSRFNAGHIHAAKSFAERLAELWPMALANLQWAGWWWFAILAGVWSISKRTTRKPAMALVLMLFSQLLFWMFFTHLQSRFLLPALVPITGLIALAVRPPAAAGSQHRKSVTIVSLIFVWTICVSLYNYTIQRGGHPTIGIDMLAPMSGVNLNAQEVEIMGEQNPSIWIGSQSALDDRTIYLLGDSTPFYFRPPFVYHTTWDESPLGECIAKFPKAPERWGELLRGDHQIEFILINWSELHRLSEVDNWYDPRVTTESVRTLCDLPTSKTIMRWGNTHELVRLYSPK